MMRGYLLESKNGLIFAREIFRNEKEYINMLEKYNLREENEKMDISISDDNKHFFDYSYFVNDDKHFNFAIIRLPQRSY